MSWNLGPQNLDWVSPSRIFATTADLFNSQPNYEHEVAVALDTGIKYQGVSPVIAGWAFATGAPVPGQPPVVTPPVNDGFTVLLLEFNGKEGSTTYDDTNAAGWPRVWTTQRSLAAFGSTTNVNEQFYPGALKLDGNTVITAPDDQRWDFTIGDFTIRGWFVVDFIPDGRFLVAKGDEKGTFGIGKFTFFVFLSPAGQLAVGGDTTGTANLLDRGGIQIVDRAGQDIQTRIPGILSPGSSLLLSTTIFNISPTWHSFVYKRAGGTLSLTIDDVVEDTDAVGSGVFGHFPGPLTIGDFAPPLNGVLRGIPWKGGLDRLAVDIGVAR